jgi:release factor glutamine methyltransferase
MSQNSPHLDKAVTLRDALREGIAQLEQAGTPSAALAAELLLMHVASCDRAHLYAHPEQLLAPNSLAEYFSLVHRRATGTPTQYLTGKQEFWGLEFEVTPDVLIPRPETEHVIEVALARVGESRRNAPLAIADIGTGSGCIAIALAGELPNSTIVAADISAPALEVAKRNAARHNMDARIQFIESNLFNSIDSPAEFDLVVSNPPYVASRNAHSLPIEIREHEPHSALFAGEDGLDVYRALIAQSESRMKRGGHLILELGSGQFEAVSELLDSARGWSRVSATMDLAGIPRVLAATRD